MLLLADFELIDEHFSAHFCVILIRTVELRVDAALSGNREFAKMVSLACAGVFRGVSRSPELFATLLFDVRNRPVAL